MSINLKISLYVNEDIKYIFKIIVPTIKTIKISDIKINANFV